MEVGEAAEPARKGRTKLPAAGGKGGRWRKGAKAESDEDTVAASPSSPRGRAERKGGRPVAVAVPVATQTAASDSDLDMFAASPSPRRVVKGKLHVIGS